MSSVFCFIMTLPSFFIFTMPTPWCISCSSALLAHHCFHPPSHIPLLCQSVDLATFHFLFPATYLASLMLLPSFLCSIPQAACCVGEGSLPFKMSGLAVFLPTTCSVAPSLPAWMGNHHLVGEGVQCMVHNLHFHRIMRRQVPQRSFRGEEEKKCVFLKTYKKQKNPKPDEKIQWEFCTFPATDITEKFLKLCKYCFLIKNKYIITIMDSAFVWWLHMQVWLVPKERGRVCAAWLNWNDWNHPMTDFCTLV